MRESRWTGWALIALVTAGLLAGSWLVYSAYWPRSGDVDPEVEAAFAPQLEALGRARPYVESAPRIRGRVAAIEERFSENQRGGGRWIWRLCPAHAFLSDSLAARTPEEVGTIAQIRCERRGIGHYVRRGEPGSISDGVGYQSFCVLDLVDVPARRTIHRRGLAGERPPEEVVAGGNRFGGSAYEEIAAWLEELPRE